MNLNDLFQAAFLGIIEGLTEFIPVSSTAHLLLLSHIINFQSIKNNLFEIVIQFGAILAICVIYRQRIFEVIIDLKKKKQQKFILNLILAFLPAAIIGVLFHSLIKKFLFSNLIIAIALIIGGLIMILVDNKPKTLRFRLKTDDIDRITPFKAFAIGVVQCFAMIPGVSRSGATIIGGMAFGLDRKTAAEFSFFLAIPTIMAASCYDLIKNIHHITTHNIELLLIGTLFAFLSAMLVITWFIKYVSKNNFVLFGIYRIIIGVLILIFIA